MNDTESKVRLAIDTLLNVCDGARTDDGAGFNGYDASFARSLHSQISWSDKQLYAAYKMLNKYSNQLSRLGIMFSDIPKPTTTNNNVAESQQEKSVEEIINALNWSDWTKTKDGRSLRTAPFTDEFMRSYRSFKSKFRDAGVSMSNYSGEWEVVQWGEEKESKVIEYNIDISNVTLKNESLFLPYQIPHVKTLIEVLRNNRTYASNSTLAKDGCALDASDTGTGKTYSALGVCSEMGLRPIVICPKAVIPSWRKAAKHFGLELLDVVNYEKIKNGSTEWLHREDLEDDEDGSKQYTLEFTNLPEDAILIFDEVHRCKNKGTINSRMLLQAKEQDIRIIGLSATAADTPLNLYALGRVLNLFPTERKFYTWARKHGCGRGAYGFQFMGDVAELKKLHTEIFPNRGSRISIKDLGDAFPETKVIADTYDMNSNAKKIQEAYEKMEEELAELEGKTDADGKNHLTVRLRARQKVELLKVPTIVELAKDHIEEGHSVAIFVNFTETLESIAERLDTGCVIRGGQNASERQQAIDNFQNDEERVIICNIRAGGVGISLHDLNGKYSRVSIISPGESAQDMLQALGRVHRAGGKSKSIQKIVYCADTIEETICENVRNKSERLHTINDGDLTKGLTF